MRLFITVYVENDADAEKFGNVLAQLKKSETIPTLDWETWDVCEVDDEE